jgi:DnaD/phage-associated family protein
MMNFLFPGFEENKKRFTGIPDQFFSEILPHLDDADELKVVLYILWSVYTAGDFGTAFSLNDLAADKILLKGFGAGDESAQQALRTAVEKAVNHRILIIVPDDDTQEIVLFINSPRGRQAAELHLRGDAVAGSHVKKSTLDIIQPNMFRLYEENIGPLTPMIAETLRDAIEAYPEYWIQEAIQIAVNNNVRRWSYISTILTRWQEEGRDGTDRRYTQEDYRRYLKGEYGDFGQH